MLRLTGWQAWQVGKATEAAEAAKRAGAAELQRLLGGGGYYAAAPKATQLYCVDRHSRLGKSEGTCVQYGGRMGVTPQFTPNRRHPPPSAPSI